MPFTNYFDQALLEHGLGGTTYTPPANLWVGLSIALPTQVTGTNWGVTEPSGNGYGRVEVSNNTTTWAPVSAEPTNGYELQNGIVIPFVASTGPWNSGNPIPYFFVADAAGALGSGGANVLFFGSLSPAEAVAASGVSLSFAVGALTTTLD